MTAPEMIDQKAAEWVSSFLGLLFGPFLEDAGVNESKMNNDEENLCNMNL